MKIYEQVNFEIVLLEQCDIVTTSPGGVDYENSDLGWGD